ncbi:MMPL family protein [Mycobacterium ulcerans str. Harvey]|uniref:MMPL family protein n=1 Tax=Mycobacterium ulcerans str. Harvey TaxID=1299332 RepID=A0ABN0QZT8_MYCUL|nr:MMPL family protein [Mycobacterium ulcerans str. Harvey]
MAGPCRDNQRFGATAGGRRQDPQRGDEFPDASSLQATKRIGKVFGEFDSDSSAMVALEGDNPLGADAHKFYDILIQELEQDTKHVEHVQDF